MFRSQSIFLFLRYSFPRCLTRGRARRLGILLGVMAIAVGFWAYPGQAPAADFTWELSPVSNSWDSPANWAGPTNQVPDDNTDTANVSGLNSFNPQLMSNKTIGALVVSDGGRVSTGNGTSNYTLIVQDNGGQTGLLWLFSDGPVLGPEGNLTFMTVYDSPSSIDVDTDDLQIDSMSELRIRQGARVQVDRNLDLNFGGLIEGVGILEMNGTGTQIDMNAGAGTGTIAGGSFEARGNVNVNSGTMVLAAPTLMTSTARVTLGANTRLRFDAPTTISDPASVVESATYGYIVNSTVNIGSGTGDLDWDGPGAADGSTVVNAGGRLNIHVGRVDTSTDTFDGTIAVNSGVLDVRTAADS